MKYKIVILISLIFILFLSLYIYKWEVRKPLFEVHFFSLNKGRAIFIRSPDNKTLLIGGGQNSDTIRELTKVIPFYRKKIDYVVIPSATPAQIGGLIEIIDRYEVGEIIMPKLMATSTVLSQLMKEINKKKIRIEKVEREDVVEIGDLKFEILFPYEDFKFNKSSLPELGLDIMYKNTTIYLMGNLSKTIQKDITKTLQIKNRENLAEFYNSASETKVSAELLEKIKSKFTFTTKEKTTRWASDGFSWDKSQ